MIVNRYTQAPAPLRLNPLSFEELSRVPLAKAQAKAEGIASLERIGTQYNVDDKDLNTITDLVSGIDQSKSTIVDDIANNGVNSQTVNNVLKLKRERDNIYKTKINQAEENKKRIDLWKQQLDEMTMRGIHSSEWADLVKNKEYAAWANKGGTFVEGSDIPTTFVPTFGPKYIDMDEDIKRTFKEAEDMTVVPEQTKTWGGGKPYQEQIGTEMYSVTPGGGRVKVATNASKLEAAKQLLLKEYADPNTERGKFANYGDIKPEDLEATLEKYKQMYLKQDVDKSIGETSYSHIGTSSNIDSNVTPSAYTSEANRESTYKVLDKLTKSSPTSSVYVKNAWKEAKEEVNRGNAKNIDKKSSTEKFLESLTSFSRKQTKFLRKMTGLNKTNPISVEDQVDAIQKLSTVTEELVKNGSLSSTMVYNATHIKGPVGDKWRNEVLSQLQDWTEDNTSPIESPTVVTEDYMRTTYGLSNKGVEPGEAAKDILKGAPNFIRLEDRKVISADEDEDEHTEILKAIADNKAEIQGVIPMLSPDLLDEKGNYMDNMSGARVVYISDKSSDSFGKKYYTKLPDYLRNTPNFRRIEGVNKSIMSLEIGQDTDMIIINKKGQAELVKVKHDYAPNSNGKLVPGNYFMYSHDDNGNVTKENLNNSTALISMRTPEFFKEEVSRYTKDKKSK
jgi:hypothetical protein